MIDDVETAVKIKPLHAHSNNLAPRQRPGYHSVGQHGDTETVNDRVDQRGGTGGLPGRLDRKTRPPDYPFKHIPGSAAGFPQEKFLFPEFFNPTGNIIQISAIWKHRPDAAQMYGSGNIYLQAGSIPGS